MVFTRKHMKWKTKQKSKNQTLSMQYCLNKNVEKSENFGFFPTFKDVRADLKAYSAIWNTINLRISCKPPLNRLPKFAEPSTNWTLM